MHVLGGASCMTIRDFCETGGMLSVWYGTCFPPPLSLRSVPPLVSCPAGMLAKLIGLFQIRQRNCSRNISPFSLCSRSPGSLEGIEALRTAQIFTSFFALHLPLIFLPSCRRKVTCPLSAKCETFFNSCDVFQAALMLHYILYSIDCGFQFMIQH